MRYRQNQEAPSPAAGRGRCELVQFMLCEDHRNPGRRAQNASETDVTVRGFDEKGLGAAVAGCLPFAQSVADISQEACPVAARGGHAPAISPFHSLARATTAPLA
jgi:hypothetical protein